MSTIITNMLVYDTKPDLAGYDNDKYLRLCSYEMTRDVSEEQDQKLIIVVNSLLQSNGFLEVSNVVGRMPNLLTENASRWIMNWVKLRVDVAY